MRNVTKHKGRENTIFRGKPKMPRNCIAAVLRKLHMPTLHLATLDSNK